LDCGRWGVIVLSSLISSRSLIYFSIIIRLLVLATLLVVKTISFYKRYMQSIKISNLILWRCLFKMLMWVSARYSIKFLLFSVIGTIIYFLNGLFVVILIFGYFWVCSLNTALCISIIFFDRRAKKTL